MLKTGENVCFTTMNFNKHIILGVCPVQYLSSFTMSVFLRHLDYQQSKEIAKVCQRGDRQNGRYAQWWICTILRGFASWLTWIKEFLVTETEGGILRKSLSWGLQLEFWNVNLLN